MTTPTLKPLSLYGPRQFATRIDLAEWEFDRARRLELIPAADTAGRWSAAVFDDVAARMDAIRPQLGTLPDVGATRAEEYLDDRFPTITVRSGTAAELARRGHLPVRGEYKGYPLYCGLALEQLRDRRKVERASAAGHLYTRDEAVKALGIRDSDFAHLLRAGMLAHIDTTLSHWNDVVPLYRQADLDRVTRSTRIDWAAVQSVPKGGRSPLAALPTRSAS